MYQSITLTNPTLQRKFVVPLQWGFDGKIRQIYNVGSNHWGNTQGFDLQVQHLVVV